VLCTDMIVEKIKAHAYGSVCKSIFTYIELVVRRCGQWVGGGSVCVCVCVE